MCTLIDMQLYLLVRTNRTHKGHCAKKCIFSLFGANRIVGPPADLCDEN